MARVKNTRQLSKTPLRRDALAILEAGFTAIETRAALHRVFSVKENRVRVGHKTYDLARYKRVFVAAIGKAAFEAAKELESLLGKKITDGLVLDVKGGRLARMESRVGTHPFPSMKNMKATGELVALLRDVGKDDLVIMVVSGGGSALLCWPSELSCDDITLLTRALMSRGASIQELNTVRKHTSDILGGQAAALAYPATVIGLVFSDVPGDDLSMVASGPTFLDTTTVADASQVLKKYDVLNTCRWPSCELKETPKESVFFAHVQNQLVVSNTMAAQAMKRAAEDAGYRARIVTTTLVGDAQKEAHKLIAAIRPGEALIVAGETTVTVKGKGLGGRNQEAALGVLETMPKDILFLACASDGIDNTPAAGAIADAVTAASAKTKRLKAAPYLAKSDSFSFFQKAGGQIMTGVTGANVSDLWIALREKKT